MILLATGVGSGLVTLFDYLESPHLISKEKAFAIASKEGNWSQNFLSDKTVDTKLFHVKNDGFTFIVDENTFQDKSVIPLRFNKLRDGQYLWIVTVTGQPPDILSGRSWGYEISATDGQILQTE